MIGKHDVIDTQTANIIYAEAHVDIFYVWNRQYLIGMWQRHLIYAYIIICIV